MYAPGSIIYPVPRTVPYIYQYPVMGATMSAPAPALTVPLTVPTYRVPTAPRQGPTITDLSDPPPPYTARSASTNAQGTASTSTSCAPAQPVQQLVQGLQFSMESFTNNAQLLSNLATSINKVVTIKFMPGNTAGIEMTITDKESRQLSLPPGKIRARRYTRRYEPEYRHRRCYCWDCCELYGSYHSRSRPEYRHRPCLCDDCLDDEY